MADYYQVKNQNIFTPPANISLGNTSNQYSNVYVQNNLVVGNVTVTSSTIIAPRVTTITYPGNDTAADPAGGQTITLTGSGFVVSASILINSIAVSVVSVVSSTIITFTSPANSSGSYVIYVVNPDGSTAIAVPGIQYSGIPTWTTAAGTLGSLYETASFTESVVATGDAPITYSVASGTLPPGATFNGNGTITGTSQLTASPTTYTFTVSATDAEQQDTNRSFSLTINTDVVTWTTPAANSTTTLGQNVASTTTLLATSAAGKAITYTANALPTGLSISGATVTGTPTVVGNTSSLFTATAATTGRTTTATINWTISVASDTYFPYTTLLLSGGTSTSTFIADASTNNFALAIAGDTKPNNFNPYTPGYYSNYFDGTGDYLTVPSNAALNLTANFTVETWAYATTTTNSPDQVFNYGNYTFMLYHTGTTWTVEIGNGSSNYFTLVGTASLNAWHHFAITRNANTYTFWIDGNQAATNTNSSAPATSGAMLSIGRSQTTGVEYFTGYISNFRLVKGVAVYTGTFTPPTAPLTATQSSGTNISAITGTQTSLLTCQSNRFLDNSTNLFAITVYGNTTVNPNNPFVPNTAYATYGSTYFDGTGYELNVASPNQVVNFGTGDFTVEFWIYLTSVPSNTAGIITNMSNFYVNFRGTGIIGLTDATTVYALTASALTAGSWFHIAVVRSAGSSKIYTNGMGGTAGACTVNFTNTGLAYIGADGNGTVPGYISNMRTVKGVAVYTANFTPPATPLSATQLANTNGNPSVAITGSATSLLTCQTNQPANNSVFLDSSTNALAVTRVGNTSAGTFSPYGANWSNYFDGTGDNLLLPFSSAFNLPADFTIECWIFPISASGMIINCGGGSNIAWASYELVWYGSAVNFAGSSANNGYDIGSETGSTGTIGTPTLNQWSHIAVTRSGNIYRGFLNGVQGYTQTLALTPYNQTTRGLAVGSNYDNTWGLTPASTITGNISNLRIVKGTAVYTANFTPSTTPLTAIANTSILTCQSNRFVDNSTNAFAITKNGDTRVQRFSPFNPSSVTPTSYSGYFGVAGEYLNFTNTNNQITFGTANFTIEFWVNFNNPTSTNTYNVVFRNYNTDPFVTDYFYLGKHPNATVPGAMSFWVANYAGLLMLSDPSLPSVGWNHFAIVRNSNIWTMYRNGTSVHSVTSSISMGTRNNNLCQIGVELAGYESNLRVVTGTAVYTSNFTPSTSPLTAISGTSLLTCQSTTFIDNSTNNFTITAISNSQPTQQNPFGFTIDLTNGYTPSTIGGSAYFDGTGDYLTVPANLAFSFAGDFTIEFWIYLLTSSSTSASYFLMNLSGPTYFAVNMQAGSFIQAYLNTSSAALNATDVLPKQNAWNHVALVRSGSTVKIYVNGTASATTATNSSTLGSSSVDFNIANGSCPANYMSDFRINRGTAVYTSNFVPPVAPVTVITNTSLLLNMTSAGVYDSTMINDLETAGDAKILSTQTPYAGSYYSNYFDGTYLTAGTTASNFLCTGSASGITATLEAWVYPTAYNTGGSVWMFSPVHSKGVTYFNFGVASGKVRFYWNDGAAKTVDSASTSDVPLNTWTHIALTISGTTFKIYVNGTLNTTSVTNSGVNAAGSGGAENIGVEGNQPTYFTGYISNYRLTNTIVYTSTFTPSITPLTAISGTQLLTCQSNRFLDNSTNAFAVTRGGDTSVQSFNPFQRNSATTMYFDGTGDSLNIFNNYSGILGTGNFTVEAWVYTTVSSGTQGVYDTRQTDGTVTGFYFGLYSTNILLFYTSGAVTLTGGTVPANTWTHIALVRIGNAFTAYLNGTSVGSATNSNNFTNTIVQIGSSSNVTSSSVNNFTGYINDLRITKGVARYTGTFTPPTTAFIAR